MVVFSKLLKLIKYHLLVLVVAEIPHGHQVLEQLLEHVVTREDQDVKKIFFIHIQVHQDNTIVLQMLDQLEKEKQEQYMTMLEIVRVVRQIRQ